MTTNANGLDLGTSNLNLNTHLINNVGTPVAGTDAANKNYVDQTAQTGTSVYAASAGSLGTVTQSGAGVGATLTNAGAQATFSLDSVNPPVGSNVLIKNTATGMTAPNEGIYTVVSAGSGSTNWSLVRATSYDTPAEINRTGLIIVQNGSTLASTAWINTANIVTVDTTSFSYSQFGSFPVTLANGGTNASLTANNGGIFYSTASAGAILSGTSTAQQLLMSGASTTPQWSTSTYPLTNTINTLLYASSANVMAALATANNGVLVTSAGGVPSISSTLPAFITSSITFSPTTGGIVGTTTNDNAGAGKVGEFVSSNIAAASAVTVTATATAQNLTSIALTAGDWNVWGNVFVSSAGSATTTFYGTLNSTSATLPDNSLLAGVTAAAAVPGSPGFSVPQQRFSLSGNATIYLVMYSNFSGTQPTACGGIYARRVR